MHQRKTDGRLRAGPDRASQSQPLRRGKRLLTLWLVLQLAAAAACAANPMRFTRLGVDAGLSEQAVNVIAQDPAGFLWFGTEDGLDRYDGYRFQHFTHSRTDPGSLPNNFIADILFDASGRQWVATDGGGIVWLDPLQGRFIASGAGAAEAAAAGLGRVRVVRTDRRGRIWIGTRDSGVVRFDPSTSRLHGYRHSDTLPASLNDNSILALLEDRSGHLWIGTDAGVDILDPDTGRLHHLPLDERFSRRQGRLRVRALLQDFQGTIWIGTDAGLLSFNEHSQAIAAFQATGEDSHSLPKASIETLYEDHEHRLWIGTTGGLVRFVRESRQFETHRNDPGDTESLPDNHVVSLFEDRGGLLWVGTKFGGLARWNPRSWSFGHRQAGAEENFASRNIMSFTEDRKSRLWVGTFGGGLTVLDPDGTHSLTLRADDLHGGLGDDRVMALLTDRNGDVWAGTMSGGLARIANNTLTITHYRHDPANPATLAANGVMALLEDSKGRLWVGTYGGGLSRLDGGAAAFYNYGVDPNDLSKLSSDRVTALAEDRMGRIWAGTDGGGLNILNPDNGSLIRLRHDLKNPHSLAADTLYALYTDPSGTVWIGTRGGGLDRAVVGGDTANAIQLANLSKLNGLPNDTIYGIVPDSAGRLWLSTNYGLACFDPQTGSINRFYRGHGLQADEFNFGAHYRSRDGRLLFGGASGYNIFNPGQLQFNRTAPAVALTAVLKMGSPLLSQSLYDHLRGFHFDYRDDVITFEFAALDFAAPAANSFEYKLEGFDRGWIRAERLRSATYTHLPGGKYTLKVRAANADGAWNMQGLAVAVAVDPPPWKTWWAYTTYSALAALLGCGIWWRQRAALLRAAGYRRQLERDVADRTHELAQRNAALQRANAKLEKVSFTDALTGLGNRRSLDHAMPELIAGLRRANRNDTSDSRLAVLLVDLDRLKPINDQHGHEAGDRLLIEVAAILNHCVRGNDKVVRWGGDEFVVVHAVSDLDGAAALAERIRYLVSRRRFQVGGTACGRTSCSIGFALYPFVANAAQRPGWEQVLNVADANLYRAKETRNAWVGCCGTVDVTDLETLAERDLQAAERQHLVRVVRSGATDAETVELLLRRPPSNSQKTTDCKQ